MSTNVKRTTLAKAADWVSKAAKGGGASPAMTVSAGDGELRIRAAGYDAEMRAALEATGDDLADFNVSAMVFAGWVKSFRSAEVALSLNEVGHLEVGAGRTRAAFEPLTQGPFRWPDKGARTDLWTLDAGHLRALLIASTFATAKDATAVNNTWQKGIRIQRAEGVIDLRAGSSYAAHRYSEADDGPDFDVAPLVSTIVGISSGLDGRVTISSQGDNLTLSDGTLSATMRLLTEPGWPDLDKLWRPKATVTVTIDREELLDRMSRLSQLGEQVHFDAAQDELVLTSVNPQEKSRGGAAEDAMTVEMEGGDEVRWGFTVAYLEQALKTMTTEQVVLAGQPRTPVVTLRSVPDDNHLTVLMGLKRAGLDG